MRSLREGAILSSAVTAREATGSLDGGRRCQEQLDRLTELEARKQTVLTDDRRVGQVDLGASANASRSAGIR